MSAGSPGAASPGAPDRRAELHLPLRPRRSRRVAYGAAIGIVAVIGLPALVVDRSGPGAFGIVDRVGIFAVALAIAWLLTRLGGVRAIPSETGLRVRNLLLERDLAWAEIVSVRFGGGGPWVLLDLDDGDTLAVMAVQRADGEFGQAEARRLATLVALHSQTPRND